MLSPKMMAATRTLLNGFFLINGKPAGDQMSDSQIEIAGAIIYKQNPRIACLAPTGHGKSEAVAMGVIIRVFVMHDNFVICSVKFDTSEVIMKKVIEHIFDCNQFIAEMEIDSKDMLSALKRERNKKHINCKRGGSVKIASLHGDEDDVSKTIGEHVPNIILDESPLLSPVKYMQVLKILEGTGRYEETFLFELGNALNRNHFMFNVKSNAKYLKIDISLEQAIREGRLDPESVDEKRGMPFFEEFYECKFPDEDEIDEKGYRQLITTELLTKAFVGHCTATQERMD